MELKNNEDKNREDQFIVSKAEESEDNSLRLTEEEELLFEIMADDKDNKEEGYASEEEELLKEEVFNTSLEVESSDASDSKKEEEIDKCIKMREDFDQELTTVRLQNAVLVEALE